MGTPATGTPLLALGHSYVLAINRAVLRALAAEQGFDVTVAAPEFCRSELGTVRLEPEPASSPLRLVSLPVSCTRWPHLFHYRTGPLERLLRERKFDIVSIWEEPQLPCCWLTARCARKAAPNARISFYSCQNISKRYPPPFSWWERQTIAWCDGWQASGELVYQVFCGRGCDPERGKVLALAVDTSLFKPLPPEARRERLASLGLAAPVIGFLGRLAPEKGIRVLLEALDLLPRDLAWSALFLGRGPEQQTIEEWARARGVEERVRVKLARHEEVPGFLGAMDLLAAPSQTTRQWKEQFGRMTIEAFACGVPVIGSDSGEIPYVIGEAGIVVPEGAPAAWAREIAGLLDDPARRERLARLGLDRAEQFSARSLAGEYGAFYRGLPGRGAPEPLQKI